MQETSSSSRVTDPTNALSEKQKALLSLGPKFSLAPPVNKATFEQAEVGFQRFAYQYRWTHSSNSASETTTSEEHEPLNVSHRPYIKRHPISNMYSQPPVDGDVTRKLRTLHEIFTNIIKRERARPAMRNVSKTEQRHLRELRECPLAITPSDKGGELCAIPIQRYWELGKAHLSDRNTYKEVPRMQASTVEHKINTVWARICRARSIPPSITRSYSAHNTALPSFHHLIKTHKRGPDLKIRPIVASRRGPAWRICHLLRNILSPTLKHIEAHLDSSKQLMDDIRSLTQETRATHPYGVSFDVTNMYPSIPISDAINAIKRHLTQHINAVPMPLEIRDITELLLIVLSQTYFTYNGQVFKQIKGLPMGCSISGAAAIIFMDTIERQALSTFRYCGLFRRYVDDIYALVPDAQAAKELFNRLNGVDSAIQFEAEHPTNSGNGWSLSLLDITISISESGEVLFSFYRKAAHKGLFMHQRSHLPERQKQAAINNESKRIAERCSMEKQRKDQLNQFRERLRNNGYSSYHAIPGSNSNGRSRQPEANIPTFYINMPFLSDGTEAKIRRAFRRHNINVRLYRRSQTIQSYLKPRPTPVQSQCQLNGCLINKTTMCHAQNVVYEISCSNCSKTYIGHTGRHLHTHSGPHQGTREHHSRAHQDVRPRQS